MMNRLCNILATSMLIASLSAAVSAQSITTTIPLPNGALGIAVNPLANRIYAVTPTPGATTSDLAVIDGSSDTLLTNIAVPAGAQFVTADYFTDRVFVTGCNYSATPVPCTVTAINGNTNTIISTLLVTTTPGFGMAGIVANPLDGLVYVANANDNVIDIISASKNALVGTISLNGNSPAAIAINPILNRLYVPYGSNQTAIVDACSKQILSTTTFGSSTVWAAVNYLNGYVYVTDDELGPSMTGVFSANGDVLASITVGDTPLGVDVDPFTNLVFVVSTGENNVSVIDGATNTIKATVSGVPGLYVAVNVATEKVYVAGTNGVTVISE